MFVDGGWRPSPEPPRRPPLTKAQERAILWIVGLNLFLLLAAPVGGASLIHAIAALIG